MTHTGVSHELAALQALERYAQDFHEFLESLPRPVTRERAEELRARCAKLLEDIPRPLEDERWKQLRDRTQERLKEMQAALSSHWSAPRITEAHEELGRAYESWIAALRSAARSMGTAAPRSVSSFNPLIRARSLFHVGMGVLGVSLYQFVLTRAQAAIILFSLMGVIAFLEITRRAWPRWNHILLTSPVFRPIARPREYYSVNSSTYYVIALCLITPLFSKPAVIAAVLVLAFADPAAAWIGKKYGRIKLYGKKSYAGSFAFLVVGFAVSMVYLLWAGGVTPARCLMVALAASLAAAIAELFSGRLDDNFTVPIAGTLAASLALWT